METGQEPPAVQGPSRKENDFFAQRCVRLGVRKFVQNALVMRRDGWGGQPMVEFGQRGMGDRRRATPEGPRPVEHDDLQADAKPKVTQQPHESELSRKRPLSQLSIPTSQQSWTGFWMRGVLANEESRASVGGSRPATRSGEGSSGARRDFRSPAVPQRANLLEVHRGREEETDRECPL